MTQPPPRTTRQRLAVRSLLADLPEFRSAQQLHGLLAEAGEGIGLATVYRTLALMAESGEVDAIITEDGETRYRRCSDDHHHHLVCVECGAAEEISSAPVERWASSVASAHGFTAVKHTVEVSGRCPDCSDQS